MVGVILCGHDGRRGYIYHTAVDRSYRRQGIGKQLVSVGIDALKKRELIKLPLLFSPQIKQEMNFGNRLGLTNAKISYIEI
ncbi:GNAT family N-acetyltransferase [Sporolactobacillus inulinus]|uniref:GNAT family N-acetyltransferase n=1 Tax=Sporolactobacillus inulinus TaxID=2078 RepID=UPI0027D94E27|nr:GNAT family N-acetyltransferase [Sporolactobacillus inulinus]